jgi:hypothetical protein
MSCTTGGCSFYKGAGSTQASSAMDSPRSDRIAEAIGSLKTFAVFEQDQVKQSELRRVIAKLEGPAEEDEL